MAQDGTRIADFPLSAWGVNKDIRNSLSGPILGRFLAVLPTLALDLFSVTHSCHVPFGSFVLQGAGLLHCVKSFTTLGLCGCNFEY